VSFYAFTLGRIVEMRWRQASAEPIPVFHGSEQYGSLGFVLTLLSKLPDPFGPLFKNRYFNSSGDHTSVQKEVHTSRVVTWIIGQEPTHPRQRSDDSVIEEEQTPTTRRLKYANKVLLAGNDAQAFIGNLPLLLSAGYAVELTIFLGIALLNSALVQWKTLSLYHMHILYDTISLVV
jgi:hypothetical protein